MNVIVISCKTTLKTVFVGGRTDMLGDRVPDNINYR